jgi:mRNA interferase MazF
MLRGELWQVDLDPVRRSEANGVVTVVYPFQLQLAAATSGLAVDSKAQAEQVRSVATQRLLHRVGQVSPADLDDALRLHLAL